MPISKKEKPINLLWTGGWDSSFRLLELVLVHKKIVQPYYIIDYNRNSTLYEIRAMFNIKEALTQFDSNARERILPTIFKEINEIQRAQDILRSYDELLKTGSMSYQYIWLAMYCKEIGVGDMEISYEKEIFDFNNRTRQLVTPYIDKISNSAGVIYRLNKESEGLDICNIYGRFNFPVFNKTKLDMHEEAIQYEFDDILELSWFCLVPTLFSNPCGKCHPCQVAYLEGLGWRLSLAAEIRYFTWPVFRKIAKSIGIYKLLK